MSSATRPPLVHIGQVVRNAVIFNPRQALGAVLNADSLLVTVSRLFALLEERQIEYVLVGGVALLAYVEGRNTEDIDLIIAVAALQHLPEIQIVEQDQFFARGQFNALQVDLLLTRNPLFEQVRRHYATTRRFAEQDVPCATVAGLLLLKLYALPSLYRQDNFARVGLYENDIATLVQAYRPALAPILSELAKHLEPSDFAAMQEVLTDIQQRIERFSRGQSAAS